MKHKYFFFTTDLPIEKFVGKIFID